MPEPRPVRVPVAPAPVVPVGASQNAGSQDAGSQDAGSQDAGSLTAGSSRVRSQDAGPIDPDDFDSLVIGVVESIPPGRVMTYGGVAAAFGSRSARGVGKVLAHGGGDLPWWRVIRASGQPPAGHEQRALEKYRVEGTPLRWSPSGSWRVDLEAASWWP